MRVVQNMDRLRTDTAMDAWVLRVTANVWKNAVRYRRAGKRAGQELSLEAELDNRLEPHEAASFGWGPGVLDPLAQALSSEHLGAVAGCLDLLPPRRRECLLLHVYQERKYQEIADLLRLSIQSVKSHIHQARHHLRDCVSRKLAPR
jgi:RNA polymerase sigma-70 factor, ECF subfamily